MKKEVGNITVEDVRLEVNLNNVIRAIKLKSITEITIGEKVFNLGAFIASDLKQFENKYKEINTYIEENNIEEIEVNDNIFDIFTFIAFKSYESKKEVIKFYKKLKTKELSKKEVLDKIIIELANFTDIKAFERMKNNAYVLLFDFYNDNDIDYVEEVLDKEDIATTIARGVVWNFVDLKNYFRKSFSKDSTYPEFNVQFIKREA
ncbi:MAG: hypothetical protein ACRC41_07790 [Sarcina sp.]